MPTKINELPPTDELRRLFFVDDNGVLRWRVNRRRARAGAIAGHIKRSKCGTEYWYVRVGGKKYFAHRIVWAMIYGDCPAHLQIDHVRGNGLNNSKENLRLVTHGENSRNQTKPRNNTSGVTGVCWDKTCGRWMAQIRVNGRQRYLGRYDTIEEAVAARKRASEQYSFHKNHGRERPDA